jgi:magnesium transporter
MEDPTRDAVKPEAASPTGADRDALIAAIDLNDAQACERWHDEVDAGELIHAVSALSDEQRARLLGLLGAESASDVISRLPELQALGALENVEAHVAARIIGELDSDERADLIKSLHAENAEAILAELKGDIADDIRRLAAYDDDTAGSIMLTEYLAFPDSLTVRELLADIESHAEMYADYNIQYTYVVDTDGCLVGVLPLRNVILSRRATPVRDVMIADPIAMLDTASLDDVRREFREHPFLGFPVINAERRLVGVIEASDVVRADLEDADEMYRQSQGIVGGEELRSMPLFLRSRRRLAWLSANIVLNILAASMIAIHQDTLEAVIALAVFLPIISDMSGCSGNQAVAVTMRELTLGVTRPKDAARVLVKEISLGLINGLALGILIGGVAYLWKGNLFLSGVVGVSLALNTVIAVCIGGLVPLLLKKFKADPALASGPILTTITDMCGFFIVLTLASMVLTSLT